uniref:Uncharacterized protein n=1 Tax=Lygus hesperus TaxID=30085 RepID=A0A146LGC2_LYGHE
MSTIDWEADISTQLRDGRGTVVEDAAATLPPTTAYDGVKMDTAVGTVDLAAHGAGNTVDGGGAGGLLNPEAGIDLYRPSGGDDYSANTNRDGGATTTTDGNSRKRKRRKRKRDTIISMGEQLL